MLGSRSKVYFQSLYSFLRPVHKPLVLLHVDPAKFG